MSGRAFSYFADTPGLPLSLKCMANGRALYKFGRAEVAVDDGGYLILNDRQPYSIEIASPTQVETFVLWFPEEGVRIHWMGLRLRGQRMREIFEVCILTLGHS